MTARVAVEVGRAAVLRYRVRAQGLDRGPGGDLPVTVPDVLDLGVQDTGTGGALWSLANRGARVVEGAWPESLALAWTVRGAPHAYRRDDLPGVEAALRPFSPADAAQRVLGAAGPLAAAGIPADVALATVAAHLREIVTEPMVKGDVSGRLAEVVAAPYLLDCRACDATHVYEMPFRLAALHGGLELAPGTSPPVLRRVPGWPPDHLGGVAHGAVPSEPRLDPIRGYLHHLGPARPADVAGHLEAPVADVTARWPADAVRVDVDGDRRWLLAADVDALRAAAAADAGGPPVVRLLGPFDPFLQARDRATLLPDVSRWASLWRALGRPGAVLADGEVVGSWRPRASGRSLGLALDRWAGWDPGVEDAVRAQAERLAAHRGASLTGVD